LIEEASALAGEIEVDESYTRLRGHRFWRCQEKPAPAKAEGKRERGAAGKVPVFELLKRGSKVFTMAVKDKRSDTLIPIIACKACPEQSRRGHFKKNFDLLLKECEWRSNYGPPDQLLKTLRNWLKLAQQ